jgi:hypothetical protein
MTNITEPAVGMKSFILSNFDLQKALVHNTKTGLRNTFRAVPFLTVHKTSTGYSNLSATDYNHISIELCEGYLKANLYRCKSVSKAMVD